MDVSSFDLPSEQAGDPPGPLPSDGSLDPACGPDHGAPGGSIPALLGIGHGTRPTEPSVHDVLRQN
jgi:hypothetical protein